MNAVITPDLLERIEKADYVWFTTVRDDGMPQPTPVWFIWENGTFLIYTIQQSQKHRNFSDNPHVALSYTATLDADSYWVIMGDAVVDTAAPPPNQNPAYLAKYASSIPGIGMTLDSFAERFSVPVRVTPAHVRSE